MKQWLSVNERIVLQAKLASLGIVICLEGNIGAGKSVVNKVLFLRGYNCLNEPVESWNLLQNFYSDASRYGFALQCQIIASYAALGHGGTVISERGPATALNVFSKMLCDDGVISQQEFALLRNLYEAIKFAPTRAYVYLDTPVDLCMERITRRGRACEMRVTSKYLETLHNVYKEFLRSEQDRGCWVQYVDSAEFEGHNEQLADTIEVALFEQFVCKP
jgi:deoxyadenosine/deoxycytidine kinase